MPESIGAAMTASPERLEEMADMATVGLRVGDESLQCAPIKPFDRIEISVALRAYAALLRERQAAGEPDEREDPCHPDYRGEIEQPPEATAASPFSAVRERLRLELQRHHKGFLCHYTHDQVMAEFDKAVTHVGAGNEPPGSQS